MTDAHTPGPWVVDATYLSEVQTADNLSIASCWHKHADGAEITVTGVLPCDLAESAANARLIAAAPDLLEACRAGLYVAEAEGANATAAIIRAAIAKATTTEQGERG